MESGGRRRKGLGWDAPLGNLQVDTGPSAFAVGMRRDVEKKIRRSAGIWARSSRRRRAGRRSDGAATPSAARGRTCGGSRRARAGLRCRRCRRPRRPPCPSGTRTARRRPAARTTLAPMYFFRKYLGACRRRTPEDLRRPEGHLKTRPTRDLSDGTLRFDLAPRRRAPKSC